MRTSDDGSSVIAAASTLPWKRYWCPRTGKLPLIDGGYLLEPTSGPFSLFKTDAVPFDDVEHFPCLVLLGEPGMGKSTALEQEAGARPPCDVGTSNVTLSRNLKAYGDEGRLVRAIFEATELRDWLAGAHTLTLVLDSLDECLLRIETVAEVLLEQLQVHAAHVDRLRLRIACRTAEWPPNLEAGLAKLFGETSVGVFELTPLTRGNVRTAAVASGVDPVAFFREVDRVSAVPLAIKPVTLDFLLRTFRRDGRLPATQNALYLEGCRLLCEEASPSRRGARRFGTLGVGQRLAVAARLAAVMVFCNRSAVYTGAGGEADANAELSISRFCGGREDPAGMATDVDEDAVREVLATSLFSSRGPERLGWAHQTYAEFLAAYYLASHNASLPQALSLILHPHDAEGRVVPQLHEAAAWLAGMVPGVRDAVIRNEPQVLLRSDIAAASAETRASLVASLLSLSDADQWVDFLDFGLHRQYQKLRHPGLQGQLEPHITDRGKGYVARRLAIDIAEACQIESLSPLLVSISLDTKDDRRIRIEAAYAVIRLGDRSRMEKLLPLAEGAAGDDPDDEFRGLGLQAVWPGTIGAERLFALITLPKELNYHGSYSSFLYHLPARLNGDDLRPALDWVLRQPYRFGLGTLSDLADAIITTAWDGLEANDTLLPLIVRIILSRIKEHGPLRRRESAVVAKPLWTDEDPRRRTVLLAAVPLLLESGVQASALLYSDPPLALPSDTPWIIEQIRHAPAGDAQGWLELLRYACFGHGTSHLDDVLGAMDVPLIRQAFEEAFRPVELDSQAAVEARALCRKYKAEAWRPPEIPKAVPPPAERVEHWLARCESGHPRDWWVVNREMTLKPDSTHYGDVVQPDLTKLPGWADASAETRRRLIAAAKQYLWAGDPESDSWLGTDTAHFPAMAGYRSLMLIAKEEPAFLDDLPPAVWQKWAPIIAAYPTNSGIEDSECHERIMRKAYERVPREITTASLTLIDGDNARGEHLFSLRRTEGCWGDTFMQAIAEKLADPGLKCNILAELMDEALRHGSEEAKAFALKLVSVPLPGDEEGRRRAQEAAVRLLNHIPGIAWAHVWSAIRSDDAWGREVMQRLSFHVDRHAKHLGMLLPEQGVAELYEWLSERFPPSEDPKHPGGGMHEVGPRESIASFRDGLLGGLRDRGTPESVSAIRGLVDRLPEVTHLKWLLATAKQKTLQRTWTPPQPAHVMELFRSRDSRLINNGDQLLDLLIESLGRWEAKLQGTPPTAFGLWDEVAEEKYRPKKEGKLSDAVTTHLRDDLVGRGVAINREVQIRPGEKPGGKGERTDIQVDAVGPGKSPGTYDVITVTVEVKGCWHRDVNTAMKTQLVDRYLKDAACQHGLYLVGWFFCPQWNAPDDARRTNAPTSREMAQANFDEQAKELSVDMRRVRAAVINTALR